MNSNLSNESTLLAAVARVAEDNARLSASTADLVKTLLATLDGANDTAPRLVHVSTKALTPFGLGPAIVRAAIDCGELRATQGSRQRRFVAEADLVAWRDSRPVTRARKATVDTSDPFQIARSL